MLLYCVNDHHFVTILLILTLPGQATCLDKTENRVEIGSENVKIPNEETPNEKTPNEKTLLCIIIGILAGLTVFVLVAFIVMYLWHKRIVERYKQRPIPTLPMVCTSCHEVYSPRF